MKDRGEPGRKIEGGGGVADNALGVAWLEVVGEPPGEDSCGDERPVSVERVGRFCRCVSSETADDSTSLSKDRRKLGPWP